MWGLPALPPPVEGAQAQGHSPLLPLGGLRPHLLSASCSSPWGLSGVCDKSQWHCAHQSDSRLPRSWASGGTAWCTSDKKQGEPTGQVRCRAPRGDGPRAEAVTSSACMAAPWRVPLPSAIQERECSPGYQGEPWVRQAGLILG